MCPGQRQKRKNSDVFLGHCSSLSLFHWVLHPFPDSLGVYPKEFGELLNIEMCFLIWDYSLLRNHIYWPCPSADIISAASSSLDQGGCFAAFCIVSLYFEYELKLYSHWSDCPRCLAGHQISFHFLNLFFISDILVLNWNALECEFNTDLPSHTP